VSYACIMELWMMVLIGLAFHGKDGLSRWLAHVLLMNAIICQAFKRFISRRRPFQFLPPRAFLLTLGPSQQRSSSFPSRVVVLGTSITYAILYYESGMGLGAIMGITIGAYFLTSLSRMHLGFNYPSDCILSLPVAALLIGGAHLLRSIEGTVFKCQ
jgi:PAP2 superfamily